jgi:hypothetical protein
MKADRAAKGQVLSAFFAAYNDMLRTFGVEKTSAIVELLGIVKPPGRPPKDPEGDKRLAADYAAMPARKKKTVIPDEATKRRIQRLLAGQDDGADFIIPKFPPIPDDLDLPARVAITVSRTAFVAYLNGLTEEQCKASVDHGFIQGARLLALLNEDSRS